MKARFFGLIGHYFKDVQPWKKLMRKDPDGWQVYNRQWILTPVETVTESHWPSVKKKFTASITFLPFCRCPAFAYGKVFGGPLKSYGEVIGCILVFYPLWRQFAPPEWVKSMDKLLRRLPLLDKLYRRRRRPNAWEGVREQLNTQLLRKNVLEYTKRQIK